MELPKTYKCPNTAFPHKEDKTVIEELWKDRGRHGTIPYLNEFVTIDSPLLKTFGIFAVVFLYDYCTECGTRFCRQIVEGKGNVTSRGNLPGTG